MVADQAEAGAAHAYLEEFRELCRIPVSAKSLVMEGQLMDCLGTTLGPD